MSQVRLVIVQPGETPDPTPGEATGVALAILALVLASLWAQRRRAVLGQRRLLRIAAAVSFFAVAAGIAAMGPPLVNGAIGGEPLIAAVGHLISGLFVLVVLAPADLVLDAFQPSRRRTWLVVAPLGFAGLLTVASALMADKSGGSSPSELDLLRIAILGAGSGLVWWALLPSQPRGLAEVFE